MYRIFGIYNVINFVDMNLFKVGMNLFTVDEDYKHKKFIIELISFQI